jgi:hypothetical protein
VTTSDGATFNVAIARLKNPTGRLPVATLRHQNLDDLPALVDRPIRISPHAGDLQIRLIHKPAVTGRVPCEAGRIR